MVVRIARSRRIENQWILNLDIAVMIADPISFISKRKRRTLTILVAIGTGVKKVMVWRCSDGAEVGLYICMKSALSEIPHASSAYDTQSFNTLGTGVVIKIQSVSECTIIE